MFKPTRKEGLTTQEVLERQRQFGLNEIIKEKKSNIILNILNTMKEPMFLLLIIAATIYFFLGEARDGAIMLIFVVGIIMIEAIQEWKTDKTLKTLKELSSPNSIVIRDGIEKTILSTQIVPNDLLVVYEGAKIPADGFVISTKGLCVDESTMTGEAQGKWKEIYQERESKEKNEYFHQDYCYAGTLVIQGSGVIQVEKIGSDTEFGKIGSHVASAPKDHSPLQEQTNKIVRFSTILAIFLFILVALFTFFNIPDHTIIDRLIESVLAGITLAMAMIPEEFPVILTVFLSLGAWRLAKNKHSLIRKLPAVETLGEVTVLCVDKTGTITENQLKVVDQWEAVSQHDLFNFVVEFSCDKDAYDPLDKAMLNTIASTAESDYQLIKAFPFSSDSKMAGNLIHYNNENRLCVKGSYEVIMGLCALDSTQKHELVKQADKMADKGLRVIALAYGSLQDRQIESLAETNLTFIGLVGLIDPPRPMIKANIQKCKQAGVRVIMITGDNGVTAHAIAHQIDLDHSGEIVTGKEIDTLSDDELKLKLKKTSIIARVIPEHKMRIVKLLKELNEVVAMTGDGVNDAPALKYADIGIAMGKRGSEVAKEAADFVLLDDNFSTIVDTIEDGRRIHDNIKRAIGYVFAIHVPIALISLLAPLLGIQPSALFLLPLHVVLLEMVIDPTCSIVLERQPSASDTMNRPPRKKGEKLFGIKNLGISVLQGLAIFVAAFGVYYYYLQTTNQAELARTMGLAVLFISNLLLVQVIGSEKQSLWKSFLKIKNDRLLMLINGLIIAILLLFIYTPIDVFFKLAPLSFLQWLIVIALSFLSIAWMEIYKVSKRRKKH